MIRNIRWITLCLSLGATASLAQSDPRTLPLPDVTLPLPAPASPAQTTPPPGPQTQDLSARVTALRTRFEALKERDAENTALRQPVSQETLDRIAEVEAQRTANESRQQIADWRAQSFAFLAEQFTSRPTSALPQGMSPGITPDIALAVIDAQASLYAEPRVDAQTVVRALEARETMLRIAEMNSFTLVWSPQDGFSFVLSQFREVY